VCCSDAMRCSVLWCVLVCCSVLHQLGSLLPVLDLQRTGWVAIVCVLARIGWVAVVCDSARGGLLLCVCLLV